MKDGLLESLREESSWEKHKKKFFAVNIIVFYLVIIGCTAATLLISRIFIIFAILCLLTQIGYAYSIHGIVKGEISIAVKRHRSDLMGNRSTFSRYSDHSQFWMAVFTYLIVSSILLGVGLILVVVRFMILK